MLRATAIALTLAALLALPACARAPKPAEAPREKPVLPAEATLPPLDARESSAAQLAVSYLAPTSPDFETAALASLGEAGREFTGLLVPGETLGRQLVAIVYQRAKSGGGDPRETLRLVYEGRLVVTEQWRMSRIRHPQWRMPGAETTTVAGSSAEVYYVGTGADRVAYVIWNAGHSYYTVEGPGLTKAEAMRIACSMER